MEIRINVSDCVASSSKVELIGFRLIHEMEVDRIHLQ